jgi:sensor domain CHASE-containing protein/PAS domain-containing protein
MKITKAKLSSVTFRLSLLLIGALVILVSYFLVITTTQHNQQVQLYKSRITSRKVIFDSFSQSSSDQLKSFAVDYTYWDDMVTFVNGNGKDTNFAKDNIDTGLGTFGANAVWVYNPKAEQVYVTSNLGGSAKTSMTPVPPFSAAQIKTIFAHNGVYHFYAKTINGVFEIYAASIHPTVDASRSTPAKGYFFVGKLIGNDFLAAADKPVEGDVKLIDDPASIPNFKTSFNTATGKTAIIEKLKDYTGQTIGAYNVGYTANDLAQARTTSNKLTYFGIALLSILSLTLTLALFKWVIWPLEGVKKALASHDELPILKLKTKPDEFGDIARLISNFFLQEKLLHAQKANVEEMVLKRSHELRQEHARLQASIDSLEIGFLLTYGSGQVAMCNPALMRILGFSASEKLDPDGTMAITLSQIEHKLPGLNLTEEINKCLEGGHSFSAPAVNSGSSLLNISGDPVRLHQSEVIGCVILVEEIAKN